MATGSDAAKSLMVVRGQENKKKTTKGGTHGLHYEILDNPMIKAEPGWEKEEAEYWTSKMCKQYVKMYHIDKLWPRDSHKAHTHDYSCKPWTCNNLHFVERAKAVWKALFGEKPSCKGYINYSVASMVYAELVLARKVDWSTYPTTSKFPILIGQDQKDIPDLFKAKIESKKELTATTTSETQVVKDTSNAVQLGPSKTSKKVMDVSSHDGDGEDFLNPKKTLMVALKETTMGEQSSAPKNVNVQKECGTPSMTSEEMVEKQVAHANVQIDRLLETNAFDPLTYVPQSSDLIRTPSPPRSLIKEGHSTQENEEQPDNISNVHIVRGQEGSGQFPILSSLSPASVKFLRTIPHAQDLEELLQCNEGLHKFQEDHLADPKPNNEASTSLSPEDKELPEYVNIVHSAHDLLHMAKVSGELAPFLLQWVEVFSNLTPRFLKGALGFMSLIKKLVPIFQERLEDREARIALREENSKLKEKCEDLAHKLQVSEKHLKMHKETMMKQMSRCHEMEDKLAALEASSRPTTSLLHDPLAHQSQESTDNLSLPLDKVKEAARSIIPIEDDAENINKWGVQIRRAVESKIPVLIDASMQTEDDEIEGLKLELDEAVEDKAYLQSELDRLQKVMSWAKYTPKGVFESRWLAWVQQLQDRSSVVSRTMRSLMELAMSSDEKFNAVESSLTRFKSVFDQRPSVEDTEITCWGDMDAMFERLNHEKKEESDHIDWVLEAEEGWTPYNTFSAHIKQKEKIVVHACDPAPGIMTGHCSLCQGCFGPEGAFIMGQCRHTFHVTCIVKASLIHSVCAECRSPLSPRFYEMLGISESMPPGHEYNRWTLPLDQGPYKFQNFLHWGKPLTWDSKEKKHGLYEESQQPLDVFMWMTSNREVELRARVIPDVEARELFCRNMGGHWSMQHQKFFRFPEKEVKKGPKGTWIEVEFCKEFTKQYEAYNHDLIGRALLLSKLEEAAKVRAHMEVNGQTNTGYASVEVAGAFDKRMVDIIMQWKSFLVEGNRPSPLQLKSDDEVVNALVDRVDAALRALKADEVDLTPKRNQKRKAEEDDDFSPPTKRQFNMVDKEVQSGGRILNVSQQRQTRQAFARLMAEEGPSRVLGEGSDGVKKYCCMLFVLG